MLGREVAVADNRGQPGQGGQPQLPDRGDLVQLLGHQHRQPAGGELGVLGHGNGRRRSRRDLPIPRGPTTRACRGGSGSRRWHSNSSSSWQRTTKRSRTSASLSGTTLWTAKLIGGGARFSARRTRTRCPAATNPAPLGIGSASHPGRGSGRRHVSRPPGATWRPLAVVFHQVAGQDGGVSGRQKVSDRAWTAAAPAASSS